MSSESFSTQQSRLPEYPVVVGIKSDTSLASYEGFNAHLRDAFSGRDLALQFLDLM